MKIEKNKIVFGSVLAVVVIFIIAYSVSVLSGDESETESLTQTAVPELDENQKEYKTKLEAIDALKEVRETNAPSIYDEKNLDSLGFYDPDFMDKEKVRIVDSIYRQNKINYSDKSFVVPERYRRKPVEEDSSTIKKEETIALKELGLEHQLFFASDPMVNPKLGMANTDNEIFVEVDGNQVVKTNYRLRMRLLEDAVINGLKVPKNTPIFGFISFKPNRALIEIENINRQPVKLKAFDLQDGSEGIYVENSFRADATREVVDDIVGDINIAGVPEVSGIQKVFRKNHKTVKVTVTNNYKLILKPKL
ncbi:MAG: conjugal transfer protein TraM [Aequorivita sp.]|nr:MAG: conjugal transfer protein TraM [Aequorivita sp.]